MKRNKFEYGRQKNTAYNIITSLTVLACIITVLVTGTFVYTRVNVNKYETSIEALSSELEEIRMQVGEVKEQGELYKGELGDVSQELSKYEEVVIPDSMKTSFQEN